MSIFDFFSDAQPDLQLMDADADNETLYGVGCDMASHKHIAYFCIVQKGEAATFTLKAQQDSASNFGTVADLLGTAKSIVIATATNGFGFLVLKNVQKRYQRPAIVCPNVGTAKVVAIFSIRWGSRSLPETNTDGELHVAPAEGTA